MDNREHEMTHSRFLRKLIISMRGVENWSIVDLVKKSQVHGELQHSKFWGHEYLDQKQSGDDSFYGYIFIPVDNKYLKIYYTC